MRKILVTGANGQLGCEFRKLAKENYQDWEFQFVDRETIDIGNFIAVDRYAERYHFDYCINCAAYTAVDKAETDNFQAFLINVKGVENLAKICRAKGVQLIHFSTDYVFHGSQNSPLKESDPVNPLSIYAQTKLEGERAALGQHDQTLILRTSWLYSSFGNNFLKTMLKLGSEKEKVDVVFDQVGTPTYAADLAELVMNLLSKAEADPAVKNKLKGVFHFSGEGVGSWYDFAIAIFEMTGITCAVKPIESRDYPTAAKRPPYSVLNKNKIKSTFGIEIPYWRDSLKRCLKDMDEFEKHPKSRSGKPKKA